MKNSSQKLKEFTNEFKALLAKYPEVTIYSDSRGTGAPQAYHHIIGKKGDVVDCYKVNLPQSADRI